MRHTPETDAVFPHAYRFEDGYLHPGEAPGHGVDIDEALAAKYPVRARAAAGRAARRRHDVELVSVKPRIVLFGEGMIEERADAAFAWGGDVVNTAVYLARQTAHLGVRPELMSAMGADAGSEAIVAAWAAQGVGVDHVLRDPVRTAGRYKISLGPDGQRSFAYDRDRSAARSFFEHAEADGTLDWAVCADILYLTGITLSIFGEAARGRIGELARAVRARGGEVVFDSNYRALGWPSPAAAWAAIEALAPAITLAMPSSDDHAALRGPPRPPTPRPPGWR